MWEKDRNSDWIKRKITKHLVRSFSGALQTKKTDHIEGVEKPDILDVEIANKIHHHMDEKN